MGTIWEGSFNGSAQPNSGVPGIVMGYGRERVIYANSEGRFVPEKEIGIM